MFRTAGLLSRIKDLGGEAIKKAAPYIPAQLSEDKRFSNAYAAALALLVCADREVEENETIAALMLIQNDPKLKDRNLVLSTLEFYGGFIVELSENFDNVPTYLVTKAQVITQHVNVSLSRQYKQDLKVLCNSLVGPNANEKEREVYNEIMSALNN